MYRVICIGLLAISLGIGMAAAEEVKDPNPPETTLGIPLGTGGPDPFGYTFIDSTEPGGPRFFWDDISWQGNQVPLSDDDHVYPIDLGFDFEFYGVTYNQVAIGSNGTLYFIDEYLGLTNSCIPEVTDYPPQTFIAGYWDDLDPSSAGGVYYGTIFCDPCRATFVVQWQDVPHFGSGDSVTFQIVLIHGTNNIRLNYLDPSSEAGTGATEGIQGDPNTGLQYGCNQGLLIADLAVCFLHPDSPDSNCRIDISVPTTKPWSLVLLFLLLISMGSLSISNYRN